MVVVLVVDFFPGLVFFWLYDTHDVVYVVFEFVIVESLCSPFFSIIQSSIFGVVFGVCPYTIPY